MRQSCFVLLFARTSFLLTRLFTSIRWSGILPAQIACILFLFCACWVFGDALLATTAKGASRGFCCNVPSRTLTLRNPFGEKRGWAIWLFYSVLSNANTPKPSQPTMECRQVAIVSVAWIVLMRRISFESA